MDWHPQVHQQNAKEDGLRPEDFRFAHWTLANVHLHQPAYSTPREVSLTYRCNIPSTTPQCNVYDAHGQKVPDPVGMCLAHVDFELVDVHTRQVLDTALSSSHEHGDVRCYLSGPCKLWDVLKPNGSVRVWLRAYPEFFYLNDQGGMVGYANTPNGQFTGRVVESRIFTLTMTHNGAIMVDGKARPTPPLAEDGEYQRQVAEYERQVEAERAEQRRIEREMEDRLAREERERQARWAREDKRRQEEDRRAREKAEAERKRNEKYIQRGKAQSRAEDYKEMLDSLYAAQFEGLLPDGDDQMRAVLRQVQGKGGDWAAAADAFCCEHGWTL